VTTYLQPHQDMIGEDRPDDPVLTMTEGGRKVLATTAYVLYAGLLFSNQRTPRSEAMFQKVTHPRPGDYVVVRDIVGRWRPDDLRHGVGIFLGDRTEWWTTDEQWEADKAEDEYLTEADRMVDHAWYVQYGPDARSVCRWVNCELFALPEDWR
jgi:hypothetical protein